MNDDTVYPASRSAGRDNAHYHACDHVQHRVAYARCLVAPCPGVTAATCPAIGMREQELLLDKAIYFVPRVVDVHDRIRAEPTDENLALCPDAECAVCAAIVCPHDDPLHFHHDGCPACAEPVDNSDLF